MATVPSPTGSPMNIDPPSWQDHQEYLKHKDDPPTEEDKKRWRKLDEDLGQVLVKKATALGYKYTLEEAIEIRNNPERREELSQLEKQYDELAASQLLNEAIGGIQKFYRDLGGKEY